MRIIGGHDYYDSALAYGSDSSVVFVREKNLDNALDPKQVGIATPITKILAKNPAGEIRHLDRGYYYRGLPFTFTYCSVIIGASRWDGLRVTWLTNGFQNSTRAPRYIWTWDNFLQILEQENYTLAAVKPSRWDKHSIISAEYFAEKSCRQSEINWLAENHISILTCDYLDFYGKFNSHWDWRKNGDNLRDLEFYRVLDAYSVFQRISEWVGGTLANTGNPMVAITDDKIKAHKHGFDRWSFRKLPENTRK